MFIVCFLIEIREQEKKFQVFPARMCMLSPLKPKGLCVHWFEKCASFLFPRCACAKQTSWCAFYLPKKKHAHTPQPAACHRTGPMPVLRLCMCCHTHTHVRMMRVLVNSVRVTSATRTANSVAMACDSGQVRAMWLRYSNVLRHDWNTTDCTLKHKIRYRPS